MKAISQAPVIIVGGGLAGLSCARRLMQGNIPFLIIEAERELGGRIKTAQVDGFLLNYGFQVLQTAYPEARQVLDFTRLDLKPFAPGAMIRIGAKFHRVADPMRRPRDLLATLKAPIGSLPDRFRILRLVRKVRARTVSDLFKTPDMPTIKFLRVQGFSERIIERFFKPFFAGVCLDAEIRASSRVFQYVLRIFADGDVALPGRGMAAIVDQLAQDLAPDSIRTGARVKSVHADGVVLASGEMVESCAVILAADGPETAHLAGVQWQGGSRGEFCLYFAADTAPVSEPYLLLNGEGEGIVNSLTVPSIVAPSYAPAGRHLISVVVLGNHKPENGSLEAAVRNELAGWFGPAVDTWRHLKTFHIEHALPTQTPPVPDPTQAADPVQPRTYVCGEFKSVPGIQWAMLSGRRTAERVLKELATRHD